MMTNKFKIPVPNEEFADSWSKLIRKAVDCIKPTIIMSRYENKALYVYVENISNDEMNKVYELLSPAIKPQYDPLLFKSYHDLGFSNIAISAIRKLELRNLGDIVSISEEEYLRYPKVGPKAIADMKKVLAKYDLTLGTKIFGWDMGETEPE